MNGVIVIDKPGGITSAEVVRRIKRLVKPARVGHLGTLDPFATGVLPILVGEATKLASFMEGGDKRYCGTIRLGAETDTLDRDGTVVRTAPLPALNEQSIAAAARKFTGSISQVPPIYSAIKRDGVPLYKLARKGAEVEPPKPREVQIQIVRLESPSPDALRFEVVCSAGTYIRSLARDLGVALGSAAHLIELRRLWSAGFSIDGAAPLEGILDALASGETGSIPLIAPAAAVSQMPEAVVAPDLERRLRNGDSGALDFLAPAGTEIFKVLNTEGRLVAIARATSRTTALIERIFND